MYSNPPMDFPHHTPSYHPWSSPPTYSTNPSFTSPTTPTFPSFPWELFTPYYTHGSSSPNLYFHHGYTPPMPNPSHSPFYGYNICHQQQPTISTTATPSSTHTELTHINNNNIFQQQLYGYEYDPPFYHQNIPISVIPPYQPTEPSDSHFSFSKQLQPTNISSTLGDNYQTYSKNKRDFEKYIHISHHSFKKRCQKKSQNPFQFTIPSDLCSFPLQTKTLKSSFSLKLRTINDKPPDPFPFPLRTKTLKSSFFLQPEPNPSHTNCRIHIPSVKAPTVALQHEISAILSNNRSRNEISSEIDTVRKEDCVSLLRNSRFAKRSENQMEVSDSSCVDSISGVREGNKSLILKLNTGKENDEIPEVPCAENSKSSMITRNDIGCVSFGAREMFVIDENIMDLKAESVMKQLPDSSGLQVSSDNSSIHGSLHEENDCSKDQTMVDESACKDGDFTFDSINNVISCIDTANFFPQDRGEVVPVMSQSHQQFLPKSNSGQCVAGVIGVDNSGGTLLLSPSFRSIPLGIPKLIVSTVASGQTEPYLGTSVGVTMFGVITPCVDAVRDRLHREGYESLVFHAIGVGDKAMEILIREGFIRGVLDITTTEVADYIVGCVMACDSSRFDVIIETKKKLVLSVCVGEELVELYEKLKLIGSDAAEPQASKIFSVPPPKPPDQNVAYTSVINAYDQSVDTTAKPYFEQLGPAVSQMIPFVEANPILSLARYAQGDAWKMLWDTDRSIHSKVEGTADATVSRAGPQVATGQSIRSGPENMSCMHQPLQGVNTVQPQFPSHSDIAKVVQNMLLPKLPEHRTWTPPSRDYMHKAFTCQTCNLTITKVDYVLLCDVCEKGFHLKCLQPSAIRGMSWALLILVIFTACFDKIVGTLTVSLLCKVLFRDALTLGFLMNTKGLVELIVLNIGKDQKVLNDQVFAICVFMALFTSFITKPIVMAVYKPARQGSPYMTKTVHASDVSYNVVVPFFGGCDDREALAYGMRMAEHPGVILEP